MRFHLKGKQDQVAGGKVVIRKDVSKGVIRNEEILIRKIVFSEVSVKREIAWGGWS